MLERRRSIRGRTYLGGSIVLHQRKSTMDCLVRNLSPEGAKLDVDGTTAVPEDFDLTINKWERTLRARTVWRGSDGAGVRFLDTDENRSAVADDLARRLRKAEAERARLRSELARMTSLD